MENGYEDDAGRAYLHLSWASVRNRQYDCAAAYVRDGIEYCTARDRDLHRIYLDTHWDAPSSTSAIGTRRASWSAESSAIAAARPMR
jgi:hypothetical protein